MGLRDAIASAFSFLSTGSPLEKRVAQYLIREHRLGRSLSEIVEDHYVRNRCTPEQIARVLEREDVIRAVGEDIATAAKTQL
jgi:hypothetical protein